METSSMPTAVHSRKRSRSRERSSKVNLNARALKGGKRTNEYDMIMRSQPEGAAAAAVIRSLRVKKKIKKKKSARETDHKCDAAGRKTPDTTDWNVKLGKFLLKGVSYGDLRNDVQRVWGL